MQTQPLSLAKGQAHGTPWDRGFPWHGGPLPDVLVLWLWGTICTTPVWWHTQTRGQPSSTARVFLIKGWVWPWGLHGTRWANTGNRPGST